MGLEVPPWAAKMFHIATGDTWSAADEDEINDLARLWLTVGTALLELAPEITRSAQWIAGSNALKGDGQQALVAAVAVVTGDGDLTLEKLATGFEELGGYLHQVAVQTQYMKIIVIEELVILAAQIAYLIAMIPWTFGTSAPGVAALQVFGRAFATAVMRQLAIAIATGEALQVGLDAIAQLAQLVTGLRKEWDTNLTRSAAITGVVGGVLGPVVLGLGHYPSKLLGKALAGMGVRNAGREAGDWAATVVKSGGHEYLTDGMSGAVQGQGWTPDTFSTAAGALDEGITRAGGIGGRKGRHRFHRDAWGYRFTNSSGQYKLPGLSSGLRLGRSPSPVVGDRVDVPARADRPSEAVTPPAGQARQTGIARQASQASQASPIIRNRGVPDGPLTAASPLEKTGEPVSDAANAVAPRSSPVRSQGQAPLNQQAPPSRQGIAARGLAPCYHEVGPSRASRLRPVHAVNPAWVLALAVRSASARKTTVADEAPVTPLVPVPHPSTDTLPIPHPSTGELVPVPRPRVLSVRASRHWESRVLTHHVVPQNRTIASLIAPSQVTDTRWIGQPRAGAPAFLPPGITGSVNNHPALSGQFNGTSYDFVSPGAMLGGQIALYRVLGHLVTTNLRPLLGRIVSASMDLARSFDQRLTDAMTLPVADAGWWGRHSRKRTRTRQRTRTWTWTRTRTRTRTRLWSGSGTRWIRSRRRPGAGRIFGGVVRGLAFRWYRAQYFG